jgi:hypothetical protein
MHGDLVASKDVFGMGFGIGPSRPLSILRLTGRFLGFIRDVSLMQSISGECDTMARRITGRRGFTAIGLAVVRGGGVSWRGTGTRTSSPMADISEV